VSLGEKHGLDLFLVGVSGVIGADGDGEIIHATLIKGEWCELRLS
jgi:hypothetical protein